MGEIQGSKAVPLFQSCLAKDNDHASHWDGQLTQTNKQYILFRNKFSLKFAQSKVIWCYLIGNSMWQGGPDICWWFTTSCIVLLNQISSKNREPKHYKTGVINDPLGQSYVNYLICSIKNITRQESSMIHSASPTGPTAMIWFLFESEKLERTDRRTTFLIIAIITRHGDHYGRCIAAGKFDLIIINKQQI